MLFHRESHPWPERSWRTDLNGLLHPRHTVLVCGEDTLPVAVLRRCVRCDDVLVAGPLVGFDEVVEQVDEQRPDIVLLCGTTDDPRLHAAMYELYEREGPSSLALIVRVGATTRCLPMGAVEPALDGLLLHLAGEPAGERTLR